MGGGGAIRNAAKAATFGAYRNVTTVTEKAAKASRIASSSAAIDEDKSPISLLSSQNGRIDPTSGVQKPTWEIDDWEFAGGEDTTEILDSMDPKPRLVFGPVPTLKEAKEATSDLKDAVDQIYFSPSVATSCGGPVQMSTLSGPLSLDDSMKKACVTRESGEIVQSALPKHVLNAFAMLKESPEVENVVASIASDTNVWEAVMKNDKVREFYQSHQTNVNTGMEMAFAGNSYLGAESMEAFSETSENVLMRFVKDIKLRVADMVNNLSEFFQGIFGNSSEESSSKSTKENIGASFMALAILVIMIVLFKRA
ncbi:uncharacterized protein LOC143861062 [Tasmannia lanceolata]|uniref:uncharacterized protein LOC143861062 n=1 Tax=Tasmannia lanceolata TaxID=3420 RepID=UPI0040637BBC